MTREAIVLCGGQGTRLRTAVSDVPKALALVCGRPMLAYILDDLFAQRIDHVVLATGYGHEQIEEFGQIPRGMEITYSREVSPLGTGGAARLALAHTTAKSVLVVNGDSYCGMDELAMAEDAYLKDTSVIWAVFPNDIVEEALRVITEDAQGSGYVEVLERGNSGPVNGGAYLFLRKHLAILAPGMPYSLEDDLLPSLAARMKLSVVCGHGPLIDIGTPERYAAAQEQTHIWQGIRQRDDVIRHLWGVRKVVDWMLEGGLSAHIVAAAQAIARSLENGGKILVCGNGGSAAEAQHFVAELMGRYKRHSRRGPLAAIALTSDTAFLTAQANDSGYETVFSRQVEGLGKPGDVLIALSTSGRSLNVIKAIEAAAGMSMTVVALGGIDGFDDPKALIDFRVSVPSGFTIRIQEMHLVIIHIFCDMVDRLLLNSGYLNWEDYHLKLDEEEE